jgi:hypothetical protein
MVPRLVIAGFDITLNDTLVTVRNSPNYRFRSGNVASVVNSDDPMKKNGFTIFDAAAESGGV